MKIAIPVDEQSADAVVSPFFGRASFYAIFEDDKEPEIVANPAAAMPSGAGIQAAQFIIQSGVDSVASTNYGPNSSMILSQAGIKMFIAQPNMTAREIYEKAKAGELQEWSGIPVQPPMWGPFGPVQTVQASSEQQNSQGGATMMNYAYNPNYAYGYPYTYGYGYGWWGPGWGRGFGWGRGWRRGWGRGFGWGARLGYCPWTGLPRGWRWWW